MPGRFFRFFLVLRRLHFLHCGQVAFITACCIGFLLAVDEGRIAVRATTTDQLGFTLVEDTYQPEQDKRWVLIRPSGAPEGATRLGPDEKADLAAFLDLL